MGLAGDLRQWYAGGEINGNMIFPRGKHSFLQVGGGGPLVIPVLGIFRRLKGNVAGACHSGEDKLVSALGRRNQLCVVELNAGRVPRHDIGHIHGKDIRPFLFQKGGAFSLAFGFGELCPGLFLFFDPGGDYLVSDLHVHAVDTYVRGGGEHIPGADGGRSFVCISLDHIGFCNDTVDIDGHMGGF